MKIHVICGKKKTLTTEAFFYWWKSFEILKQNNENL